MAELPSLGRRGRRYTTSTDVTLALAIVVVLTAVAASANAALASSWSGSTSIQTTHVFAPDSRSGGTDWWPFLSK